MWSSSRRRPSQLSPVGVVGIGLSALACTGLLDGSAGPSGTGDQGQPPNPDVAKDEPVDPGFKAVHRLNTVEYNATVQDVTGTSLSPATDQWRGGELGGFDNNASVLGVDADQYERYFQAAEQVASDVFSKDELRAKFLPCTTADDPACVGQIAATAGLRFFRRPLLPEEIATYSKVYAAAREQGDDHVASARLMVQAFLSSAEFIYRIELDPTPGSAVPHALSAYELASRLSYFLWSSAPDDHLLDAARTGELTKPNGLSQFVDYLLGDSRSRRFVAGFAGQWLGARKVLDHPTAPDVYPDWNAEIAAAAAQEMYLYFDDFLRSGRSYLEFMTADMNFVNAPLAAFYASGTSAPATAFVKVEGVDDGRVGFAGLVGFLAMSSPDRRSSPTLRGAWLLRNVMCSTPPDPPPNVPELEQEGKPSPANVREALSQHRSSPACAGCHSLFDPFGLALEQYDGIGKFRTTYEDGTLVDAKTSLNPSPAYPNGLQLDGLTSAAHAITQNPAFATCVSQKLLQYGLGRVLVDADEPYLARVNAEWLASDQSPSLTRLIQGLVASGTFTSRRGEGK